MSVPDALFRLYNKHLVMLVKVTLLSGLILQILFELYINITIISKNGIYQSKIFVSIKLSLFQE